MISFIKIVFFDSYSHTHTHTHIYIDFDNKAIFLLVTQFIEYRVKATRKKILQKYNDLN
jgi:hypothetical protein